MASYEEVRLLPKFGEWDVNDPASAEGFSGIFNRARNEKVAWYPSSGNARSMRRHDDKAGKSRSAVVPLYVATKMASIKRSSFFVPSANGYARADLQWIGYEPRCTPYGSGSVIARVSHRFMETGFLPWHPKERPNSRTPGRRNRKASSF